jgi:ADP-heptose:LPS heptosyltransferase
VTVEKILLLRPDKAGDALKTLPVLRALRQQFPNLELHLLASENNASLFEFEPGIKVHQLPKSWKKMKPAKFLETVFGVSAKAPFSKVISLLCDRSEEVEHLFRLIPGVAKFAAWPPQTTSADHTELSLPESSPAGRDETENISLLINGALGVELHSVQTFSRSPVFSPLDENEALDKMGQKQGHWMGFCPFAGNKNRSHPMKRWAKFVAKVTGQGGFDKLFLFGAPADYRQLQLLRDASHVRKHTELCFPSSFRALGAYLKRLDGVVAVDSGPLHLARSLGVHSLGILSGGDVARWYTTNNPGDLLIRRGIFSRFPTALEMKWAFEKWRAHV